jgi:hypothetical protein
MLAIPLLTAASVAAAQSTSLPGSQPPAASGLSTFGLQLSRLPRFTRPERGWAAGLHADVAIKNSSTRVALSASRLAPVDGARASLGGGLAVTQVVVERDSPARMGWLTAAAGVVGLRGELHDGATAVDLSVGGGAAQRFAPPGIGELALSLAPRVRYRRLSPIAGFARSTAGAGAALTLDWASRKWFGALVAFDVEWLADRPPGDRPVQTALTLALTSRLLLFPRKARLPPPEPDTGRSERWLARRPARPSAA